ncbi:hypothetical protein [Paenibacillus campinasensis]|uniref:F0F1-type ATP synthase n=1 Tax=Paenibacillus campinasensis TaxID=66347 RepID=A0A268EDY2_9BACL|nr:hypothetical protein [Paenibacillus campinasensis]PAD71336.1 hypothetical protein CHH67_24640 [Paenibacillus campinasensis]
MKIINIAIMFVLIFFPFFFIMDIQTRELQAATQLEDQYDAALKTAVQDAGFVLNQNEHQEYEAGYQSTKFFRANKELAVDTFFKTLYLNFGVEDDPIGQGALAAYIPAIVVLDYDGYHLYTLTEFKNADGLTELKHMWRPKKPYAYVDSERNTFNFTLDNYVTTYVAAQRQWMEGYQWQLQQRTGIEILNDPERFEAARRSSIVNSVQEDLAHFINKHNQYSSRTGISYTFKLPLIPQEDWANTIDDIGIMAFIQGMPVGTGFYNNYAFGGGRLVKKKVFYGGIDPQTGMKYYYRNTCAYNYQNEEVFSSERDAAAAGYFPKDCLNDSR